MTSEKTSEAARFVSRATLVSTAQIVDAVRRGGCRSRSDIAQWVHLSKALVSERVRLLTCIGLFEEDGELSSRGGRRATNVRLRDRAGFVLAVEIAMTHVNVSSFDLSANVLESERVMVTMKAGPEEVLATVERLVDAVLSVTRLGAHGDLLGVGVGVAGPVEFMSGRTVHPPVHPAWHDQPIRDRLTVGLGVPVWVDNEVNLMALAEAHRGAAQDEQDVLVFKIGSWVGAGLISGGRLHRGAKGCAGSLVTSAGGDDIAHQGELLALSGQSAALAKAAEEGREIRAELVSELAHLGDQACQQLLDGAADDVGRVIAVVTDFFNPGLIVVSGGITSGGDSFLARVRQVVYGSALALATQDLRIVRSALGPASVSIGAALLAVDSLLGEPHLAATLQRLSPAGAGKLR